jgi:hypothetical protein
VASVSTWSARACAAIIIASIAVHAVWGNVPAALGWLVAFFWFRFAQSLLGDLRRSTRERRTAAPTPPEPAAVRAHPPSP